ncbi:MAG: alanine--tRNA ligase [Parcubacteria group bacterium]|nr:alanine--tRNA ligase [Parcubacteria group bacterium]
MTAKELRKKYLNFFEKKGHKIIPSASLIPENDPTVLFTTAGMHPLVPYLMGEKHPRGKRLVNFQKCLRTGDIEEVGDNWHLTFFEMLGNWSLNDYWKKEAIEWSFEFLTKELKIPIEKLAVSVFKGDKNAPEDRESYRIWKALGISKVYKYSKKDNWWGPAGKTGPCGPDTEIFYIRDVKACGKKCEPSCSCGKYVEIWNNVFMEYHKNENEKYEIAKQKNVDTGMGVERVVAVLNDLPDNYHCEHIWPIVKEIERISGAKYEDNKHAIRIITDHVRSAVFILGDEKGVAPSNLEQGYVLRRLIRRSVRFGIKLGIKEVFTFKLAEIAIGLMKDTYPELKERKEFIIDQLIKEEKKFAETLEKGLKEFKKMSFDKRISGNEAFILFSTYGFPLEMTEDLAKENNLKVDVKEFEKEFASHQDLSRAGAEKRFKGGLADASDETCKLHTATHLLHTALKQVLGKHVKQRGSNITPERLRFDFNHEEKMTPEQIEQVEKLVNGWIEKNLEIKCEEIPYKEAEKRSAVGLFKDKYGDVVKVYSIGDISCELCGGPHAKKTKNLGKFKIKKEKSASAGVRRIKAILE